MAPLLLSMTKTLTRALYTLLPFSLNPFCFIPNTEITLVKGTDDPMSKSDAHILVFILL